MKPEAGIVGLGRCGRVALELLSPRYRLTVTDRVDRSEVARSLGAEWSSLETVAAKPEVLLAVPIRALPETLDAIAPHLRSDALVVDVCSVKAHPLAWMRERLPAGVRYVGTHPLFGPDSVGEQGFEGQRIAVCAAPGQAEASEHVGTVASELGLVPVAIDADLHDQQMARSQAIVFLLARAMRKAGLEPAPLGTPSERRVYSALGLVAGDTDELYEDILRFNPHVPEPVRSLCAAMQSEVDRFAGER